MVAKIIYLAPPTRPATFRAMARKRLEFAQNLKLEGDEEGYLRMLDDVRELDRQATLAKQRAERLMLQQAERRGLAKAAGQLLDRAKTQRQRSKKRPSE